MKCLIDEELIRREFPVLQDTTWFATGIVGIMPKSAAKNLADAIMKFETEVYSRYQEVEEAVKILRGKIASLISAVNPTDICFTRNATEGITIALSNIDLNPDDEILTSDQEHEALMYPLNHINKSGMAKVKKFKISKEPKDTLQSVKEQISHRTKLLASSHISCQTGIRLPVKEMGKIAREIGAYVLFDGAQTVGNIDVNVRDYSCDFYICNGHKWLCGPKGTSFLYINPESTLEPSPRFLALGNFSEDPKVRCCATRFEYGTRGKVILMGLLAVLELYEEWNWLMKAGRIKELSSYFKENLHTIHKCIIHTSDDWEKSSGNTSFTMDGYQWNQVSEHLKERNIIVRGVPDINSIRISTNYYNNYDEIDKLIEALNVL
ncbi:aminotransferase class V-fold PLP-dependent enzyme [Candidatus Poribacteria bacterium]|nr:aminotransferase class V-fold PLP-dependent enzyme [Candidatus Poribacteria bacterium]